MTPHNITNLSNNLKITELALYNIVEFQAFGSRPLRQGLQTCKSDLQVFYFSVSHEILFLVWMY